MKEGIGRLRVSVLQHKPHDVGVVGDGIFVISQGCKDVGESGVRVHKLVGIFRQHLIVDCERLIQMLHCLITVTLPQIYVCQVRMSEGQVKVEPVGIGGLVDFQRMFMFWDGLFRMIGFGIHCAYIVVDIRSRFVILSIGGNSV